MKRTVSVILASILLAGVLSACGTGASSSSSTQSAESAPSSAVSQSSAADAAPAVQGDGQDQLLVIDGKPAKIVYVSNECTSAWQSIGTEYLKSLVEKAGGECSIFNPENDSQKQAQMVEDAMILQPDILVIKPIDAVGIVPTLKRVNEAGIPIIAIDTGVTGDVKLLTHIQTDQYSLGSVNAEYVAKVFAEKGKEAKVVTVLGDITSTIAQDRQRGFNETAAASGNITVLAETESKWDPNTAYDSVLDMFQRHPDANTVFIQADCMQSGVMQALKELDRLYPVGDEKHVTVVSIDGDPSGVKYLSEGYCDHLTEHNAALHSDIAYKVIIDYLHGYTIPETLYFPTSSVTKADLGTAERWGELDTSNVSSWLPMDHDKYIMQTTQG